jgi:hypothetical protein
MMAFFNQKVLDAIVKTDTIFYSIFQTFPSFFFELIARSPETAADYEFTSREIIETIIVYKLPQKSREEVFTARNSRKNSDTNSAGGDLDGTADCGSIDRTFDPSTGFVFPQ